MIVHILAFAAVLPHDYEAESSDGSHALTILFRSPGSDGRTGRCTSYTQPPWLGFKKRKTALGLRASVYVAQRCLEAQFIYSK